MFECPPYPSSKLLCFVGLQAQASLLHSGDVLSKRWASSSYGEVGPIGQQGDLGLGERTLYKFYTHLSVDGIVAVDPELSTAILWVIIIVPWATPSVV